MKKLVGVFGGTFDPVHLGHLNAVNELCRHLHFYRVHWVLSARPPHKDRIAASILQRFEMLQAALADYPAYVADDCEIKRQDKSYTVDTVEHFQLIYPGYAFCLIIGADSLQQLHSWHRYQELIEQVHIVVLARPGYSLQIPEQLRTRLVESPDQLVSRTSPGLAIFEKSAHDISATGIRALLTDKSVLPAPAKLQILLPQSVIDYIQNHQIYTIDVMNPEKIKNQVVTALEETKGVDIRVIDIKDISDFADYMVVASGTSVTHVRALARAAADRLRKQGVKPLNEDGVEIGEWVLIDFGDVVLHVMRPEVRDYYELEKLWDQDVRELVKKHRERQET